MQKKIIALAIAAALTSPALALADTANVNAYGVADVSLDFVTTGDGVPAAAATKGTSERRVSSNQSRLGLKGSEDLGGGLSATWQMEGLVNIDAGTSTLFDRNTFVGLTGGFGTVLLGRHDTPYKMATRKLDVFADSIADNRSLMGGVGISNLAAVLGGAAPANTPSAGVAFDGRQSDVLAYVSPAMGGVTGALALINLTESNTLDTQTKVEATSLAVMYNQGPIYASLGYETHNIKPSAGSSTSEKATKLGFGYTMTAFSVGVVYEKTSDDFNTGGAGGSTDAFGHTGVTLNGKFNISSADAVKAAYTKAGLLGGGSANADTGAKQIAVGYDHDLSKRTTVYALYTKLSNDNKAAYQLFGGNTNTNVGASPSAVSFGVKHMF